MDIDIVQLPGILRRRWGYIMISASAGLLLALLYAMQLTPLYSSSTQLIIDTRNLLIDNTTSGTTATSSQQDPSSLDTQLYVVLSRAVLDKVVVALDLTKDNFLLPAEIRSKLSADQALAAAAGNLRQHVTAERAGQSQVMVITAQHPDAGRAADIANSVADTYLEQIEESRADAANRASSAFQTQADELRDRVLKAEIAVEQFKAENGLASTGEGGLVIDQQLAGINDQLIAARGVEEQQLTIYEQAKRLTMDGIKSGGIPEALQSQTIELLRDRYVQLLDRQTQLEANLGTNHPQLRAVRSQVANMQQALEQELARLRQSMQSSYERAASNTKALQQRLETMTRSSFDTGTAQIRLRQLESEAEAVRALHKSFLNRAEELGQQQSLRTNNSRVITVATPGGGASKLVLLVIVAAGVLFGTVMGAVLAVGREILDRTFAGAAVEPNDTDFDDFPVLARLPDYRQTPATGLLSRLSPMRRPVGADPLTVWRDEISAFAKFVAHEVADEPFGTVVFLSKDKLQGAAADLVPDVVQALVDLGYDIRYAPGGFERMEAKRDQTRRPSLVDAIGREEGFARTTERLRYQYFSSAAQERRAAGRPSVSRYMGTSSDGPFITIINGCGTEAGLNFETLLSTATRLVVVQEGRNDIQPLLERLSAWRHIALGRVVVGDED